MSVNLSKGQKIDLTKGNPGLTKVLVGLGWDVNKYDGGADFDLDAAAFMLRPDLYLLRGSGNLYRYGQFIWCR